jgi:hypothetical protein
MIEVRRRSSDAILPSLASYTAKMIENRDTGISQASTHGSNTSMGPAPLPDSEPVVEGSSPCVNSPPVPTLPLRLQGTRPQLSPAIEELISEGEDLQSEDDISEGEDHQSEDDEVRLYYLRRSLI